MLQSRGIQILLAVATLFLADPGIAMLDALWSENYLGLTRSTYVLALVKFCGPLLLVVYGVHLVRNAAVDKFMKIPWALLLYLGGMPGMMVYWVVYIWGARPVREDAVS